MQNQANYIFTNPHDGATTTTAITSEKALTQFYQENDVICLLDSNRQILVRPNFKGLVDGAKYTLITIADIQLRATATTACNRKVDETLGKDLSAKSSLTKVIIYNDAAGNVRRVMLDSDATYTTFLSRTGMRGLVDPVGNEVYSFGRLVDGATYTMGRPLGSLTSAQSISKATFPYHTLPSPEEVPIPPVESTEPTFIAQDDWMERLTDKVAQEFLAGDHKRPSRRVEPMALVGCSRSGKSRALREIAQRLKTTIPKVTGKPVIIIMVTFGDYSPIVRPDDEDPLQALLQRMVFEVQSTSQANKESAYLLFRSKNYYIDEAQIWQHWLDDAQAILLIDELNNLLPNANDTHLFGAFIRSQFVIRPGRYLIFSTNIRSTLRSFVNVVDNSPSGRDAMLQMLPTVQNLSLATEYLNPTLQAREAVSLALLPALIYTQRYRNPLLAADSDLTNKQVVGPTYR